MRIEPATILVIVLGSLSITFFLLPLLVVLRRLPDVRQRSRGSWLLLVGITVLTGFFFIVLFAGAYTVLIPGQTG